MKLNHYLAQAGICSRRAAVELIKSGAIQINHTLQKNPAYEVSPTDLVYYRKKQLSLPKTRYFLVNKPINYVTTTVDEEGRRTVLHLLPASIHKQVRLFPVGRLDQDTSGLILLTNDGAMAQQLAHPKYKIRKSYLVTVDQPLKKEDLETLKQGRYLVDGRAHIDNFKVNPKNPHVAMVTIHNGKKHIIRRLFDNIGYTVRKLERVAFGPFTIHGIQVGTWKEVTFEPEQQ
ncbi:MAG: pseudouridine synthase [Candidatus Babeliales bacterium]